MRELKNFINGLQYKIEIINLLLILKNNNTYSIINQFLAYFNVYSPALLKYSSLLFLYKSAGSYSRGESMFGFNKRV